MDNEVWELVKNHEEICDKLIKSNDKCDVALVDMLKMYGIHNIQKVHIRLMDMLVNGKYSLNSNYQIRKPSHLRSVLSIVPLLSLPGQSQLLTQLVMLLSSSTNNCQQASNVYLIEKITSVIDQFSLHPAIQQQLVQLIGTLGKHHIDGREVKALLKFIVQDNNRLRKDLSPFIIQDMVKMTIVESPSSYFSFYGEETGIKMNTFQFPQREYSISTYIRLEKVFLPVKTPMRLFSMLDRNGDGIEVYFKGNQLYIAVSSGRTVGFTPVNMEFKVHQWYHLVITQPRKKLLSWLGQKRRLQVYINSELKATQEKIKYPGTSNPVIFGYIGSSTRFGKRPQYMPFYGQMGPFALFSSVLSESDIKNIYESGHDFQYVFSKDEMPPLEPRWAETMKSRLALVYNPRACTRLNVVHDNSPNGTAHGKMLHNTQVYSTQKLQDALSSIGGIQLLFQLVVALKNDDTPEHWTVQYQMLSRIIELIETILKYSQYNRREMAKNDSFQLFAYLLSKIPPVHLDTTTVKNIKAMIESIPDEYDLRFSIFKHFIINFRIWKNSSFSIQKTVLDILRTHINNDVTLFRKEIGVTALLDILRLYYSFQPESSLKEFHMGEHVNGHLNQDELYSLRKQICYMFVDVFIDQVHTCDVRALLNYLLNCDDELQQIQFIKFLTYLLLPSSPSETVSNIIREEIINTYFPSLIVLVTRENYELRYSVIRFIGTVMAFTPLHKQKMFYKDGLFEIIKRYSLLHANHKIDVPTFNMMLEIILGEITLTASQEIKTYDSGTIKCPFMIDTLLSLVAESEDFDLRLATAKQFHLFFTQKDANKYAVLSNDQWQNLFIQLARSFKNEDDEPKSHHNIIPVVLEIIAMVIEIQMSESDTHKIIMETLNMLACVSGDGHIEEHKIQATFLDKLLPHIVKHVSNISSQDTALLENLFVLSTSICRYCIGVKPVHNEHAQIQKQIANYFIMSIVAPLLAKATTSKEIMLLIHESRNRSDTSQSGYFMSIVQKGMQYLSNNPLPDMSLFVAFFQICLFAVTSNDDQTTKETIFSILMLLLTMDIALEGDVYSRFQIKWEGEIVDSSLKKKRVFYIMAVLFHMIQQHKDSKMCFNLLRFMIKGQYTLILQEFPDSFTSQLAEDPERVFYLKSSVDVEGFIEAFYSTWKLATTLAPLSTVYTAVTKYYASYHESTAKHAEEGLKNVVQNLFKLKTRVEDSRSTLEMQAKRASSKVNAKETTRIADLCIFQKRSRHFCYDQWKKMKDCVDLVYENYDMQNFKYSILDQCENHMRMRLRLLKNPHGTPHRPAASGPNKKKMNEEDNVVNNTELAETIMQFKDNSNIVDYQEDEGEVEDDGEEEGEIDPEDANEFVFVQESDAPKMKEYSDESLQIQRYEGVQLIEPLSEIFGMLEVHMHSAIIYFLPDEKNLRPRRYDLTLMTHIFRRRKLMKMTAIELFFKNGNTVMFNAPHKIKNYFKVPRTTEKLLPSGRTKTQVQTYELVDNATNIADVHLSFRSLRKKSAYFVLDGFHYSPKQLVKKLRLTERWQSQQLSNFEYIMWLNTCANRTYNDINQYPVFPWVLNDYSESSKRINLDDPSSYRDFRYPIGAQNEKQRQQCETRYDCFGEGSVPAFHHGTHYLTCGAVNYFLIRMEPFASLNVKLQGETFDLADRLFTSIGRTFNHIAVNSGDVKELTPEFFYMPEMFVNSNNLNLGLCQDGEKVDNVSLPGWARTPEEFVRIHREALESDHVSEHLHEWLHLTFGFKQRLPHAADAYNVYYYLTYEGAVRLDRVDDPVMYNSIETQLMNFGQVPSQLFSTSKSCPPRWKSKPYVSSEPYWNPIINAKEPFFSFSLQTPQTADAPAKKCSVLHLSYHHGSITTVNQRREYRRFAFRQDKPNKIMTQPIGSAMAKDSYVHSNCFLNIDNNWMLSCNHFDKSLKCVSLHHNMAVKQSLFHKDIVTCIDRCGDFIVSGCKDSSVQVWKFSKPSTPPLIPWSTLYGHEREIRAVCIDASLSIVVSGDLHGHICVHNLWDGKLLRIISHPNHQPINLLTVTPSGTIIFHSLHDKILYAYSLNGKQLAEVNVDDKYMAQCMTSDGRVLFLGGVGRRVSIRATLDLKEIGSYHVVDDCIRSMTIKNDRELIIGTDGGMVLYYAYAPEII